MRAWVWLALVCGGAGLASKALAGPCERRLVAEARLRDDGGSITVPVEIAGRAARMVVDTGSDGGLVTQAGAARLGLVRDPAHRTLLRGTGGVGRTVPNASLPGLRIGGMAWPARSVPVGSLPAMPMLSPPVAGLIGADILSRFDVEIDLPGRSIRFWRIGMGSVACAPPPVWSEPYDSIALALKDGRATLPVVLDGHRLVALLDSGARSRILSTRAAARLGVGPAELGVDPGGVNAGIDLRDSSYHWHRFHSLTIGSQTTDGPVLTVAPVAEAVDLLLGADWFASRQVWISYSTSMLFVRGGGRGRPGLTGTADTGAMP